MLMSAALPTCTKPMSLLGTSTRASRRSKGTIFITGSLVSATKPLDFGLSSNTKPASGARIAW